MNTRFLPPRFYPNIRPDKRGWVNSRTGEVIIARHGLIPDELEILLNPNFSGEIACITDIEDDPLGVKTLKTVIYGGITDGTIAVQDNDSSVLFNFTIDDWQPRGNTMVITINHNLNSQNLDAIIKDNTGRVLNMEYSTPSNNRVELIITDSPEAIFTGSIYLIKVS